MSTTSKNLLDKRFLLREDVSFDNDRDARYEVEHPIAMFGRTEDDSTRIDHGGFTNVLYDVVDNDLIIICLHLHLKKNSIIIPEIYLKIVFLIKIFSLKDN